MEHTRRADLRHLAPGFILPGSAVRTISSEALPGARWCYTSLRRTTSRAAPVRRSILLRRRLRSRSLVIMIGVLKDPIDRHDQFVKKHGLDLALVCDAEGNLCERYGTRIEKSMCGRRYIGIERATYLIDTVGVLRRDWRKVKIAGRVADIVAALRAL